MFPNERRGLPPRFEMSGVLNAVRIMVVPGWFQPVPGGSRVVIRRLLMPMVIARIQRGTHDRADAKLHLTEAVRRALP